MPYDAERHARLYYDRACGPCTFLARAASGLSHGRLETMPLDAPAADAELGRLSDAERYGAAHLVEAGVRRSGAEVVGALVGPTFGRTASRVFRRVPPLDPPLRWLYLRFWSHRQRHGCGAPRQG